MRTIPLHGKRAAGRVARVDDGDYELVSQYRWHVYERMRPGRRPSGPYAEAYIRSDGPHRRIKMHVLIMGFTGIDHANHDGLDNQRHNLRPATYQQNAANMRPNVGTSSEFKGVFWVTGKKRWKASVASGEFRRSLGYFDNEVEAAYAYDDAARDLYGEYACTNFPEPPSPEMRDQWRAEHGERKRARREQRSRLMRDREPRTYTCEICNSDFQSASLRPKIYCSKACGDEGHLRRARERQGPRPKPPARTCVICGTAFDPGSTRKIYCAAACKTEAEKIADAARPPRPRWQGRVEPGTQICAECGSEFRPKTNHAHVRYCSKKCCRIARTKRERRMAA